MKVTYIAMEVNGLRMDKKEGQNLALTLFRKDLDKNDVVTTLMKSNVPESTAYRWANKAYEIYEWETEGNEKDDPKKSNELKALDTIYKAMKWAESKDEQEMAVKFANLYITNKKRLKK